MFPRNAKKGPARKPVYLYNTLSRSKEEFVPLAVGKVKMYNCGPTVYDEQHIGNLRAYVFANTLRRMLEYNDYVVDQVVNITDVGHLTGDNEGDADTGEDKMEKGAKKAGMKTQELAAHITELFINDLKRLNIDTDAITFTKATDFIPEQIALVRTLEEKGYTYKTSDGVYYDTSRFPEYGKLGNVNIAELKEGARVEANPEKLHPTDFALWKFSPPRKKRQQEWDSPWGKGFPGWHLECTAMIFSKLGKQIDIHTGGIDHIPVHHNNEIAQAEAVTNKEYVKYWLHVAFITIDGQKISKSIGNTIHLRNIIDRDIAPLAYRYLLLTAHYRSPLNFTWDALEGAQAALFKLHRHFVETLGAKTGDIDKKYEERFHTFMNDDLDTPKAVALLFELMKDTRVSKPDQRATMLDFDHVLGLGLKESNERLLENLSGEKKIKVSDAPEDVRTLLKEREVAREEKDWTRADELRDKIEEAGYHIIDTDEGARLTKKE